MLMKRWKIRGGGGEAGLKQGFPVSLLPRDSEMLVKENPELKK